MFSHKAIVFHDLVSAILLHALYAHPLSYCCTIKALQNPGSIRSCSNLQPALFQPLASIIPISGYFPSFLCRRRLRVASVLCSAGNTQDPEASQRSNCWSVQTTKISNLCLVFKTFQSRFYSTSNTRSVVL